MENEISIKDIHNIILNIYIEVNKICIRHGWKLFLTGGSVIGAVRHKGFIPWDDDMDLALSRKEFDEFAEVALKELPSHLKLRWMKRGQHYTIIDSRYEMSMDKIWGVMMNEGDKAYAFVDLQPFDGVPNNSISRLIHCFRVMFNRMCFKMHEPEKILKDPARPIWEKVCINVIKKLGFLFRNEEKILGKYSKSMKKYSYEDCNYIADFCGHYHFKDIYPKDWWEPGLMVPFEDIIVRIPTEYDKYLTRIYGNYMQIPDKNKRVVHMKLSDRSS